MEVKIENNKIRILHRLKKGETYKINKYKNFETFSVFKKPLIVKGIASRCSDGKHCLFIDYDNCPLWLVKEDFLRIQMKYNLTPAYLFCTKEKREGEELFGNYHVICLSKFFPGEIYNIIKETHADTNFMSMPLRNKYRNWILRVGAKGKREKPKFKEVIGLEAQREISSSHLEFLKKIYNLPEIKYKYPDGLTEIKLQEYETLNF